MREQVGIPGNSFREHQARAGVGQRQEDHCVYCCGRIMHNDENYYVKRGNEDTWLF